MSENEISESPDSRQSAILNAAIRVLAREGLAATTTRKIAAEADVNQAMLGYYFGSKDELFFAVLQELMRQTQQLVMTVRDAQWDLPMTIIDSITAFWLTVEAAPELQLMQMELTLYAIRKPESAWLAKQQYAGYSQVIETLFATAYAETGQTCAISFAALSRFVIGGLDGLILQFVSDRNVDRARQDLTLFISSVLALVNGAAPTLPTLPQLEASVHA